GRGCASCADGCEDGDANGDATERNARDEVGCAPAMERRARNAVAERRNGKTRDKTRRISSR
ncbi:hypothetical protein ACLUWK_09155, partial [Bifidobacterium apri]|uniref:hypothetical protein n=1 Tax=Bifidobacterium apri TaxID=1769423 RepID=UPI003995DCF9